MALSTSLVSYWTLNGNSNDSVGSNNGTDTSITYNASNGFIGTGAGFNGTTSKIDLGTPSNLNPTTGAFSISAWVKLPDTTANDYTIMANRNTTPFNGFLFVASDTGGKLTFIMKDASTTGSVVTSNSYTAGVWFHAVCTYDGAGNMAVYLNNTKTTGTYAGGSITSANNVYLGAAQGGSTFFNNGALSQVGFWSKQLSDAEVTQLYNMGSGLQYAFASTPIRGGVANSSGTSTAVNCALTTTGTHVTAIVFVQPTIAANITSCTVNGVAATQIGGASVVTSQGSVMAFALTNAGAFSGNVTVNSSSSQGIFIGVIWYNNTSDSALDNTTSWATSASGTITSTITPIADNCRVVGIIQQGGGTVAAQDGTQFWEVAAGTLMDNNGFVHPAASTSVGMTGNTGVAGYMAVSLAPFPTSGSVNSGFFLAVAH